MHADLKIIIVTTAIAALVLLIFVLLLSSIARRIWNDWRYGRLDALRQLYSRLLAQVPGPEGAAAQEQEFRAKPGTIAWHAVEDVLLAAAEGTDAARARVLFQRLGYTEFYEKRIRGRKTVGRAAAIDKLGRIQSTDSVPKLLPLLGEKEPEVLSVTVRALSRIGTTEALAGIIARLPYLLGENRVTRKTMETSLLNFGEAAIPALIDYHGEKADPWIISCILETLAHLLPDERSLSLALVHLHSPNAEVRSKCLKVLANFGGAAAPHLAEQVLTLLDDPVWFVRLQAAKSAGALAVPVCSQPLGKLLFDSNWQVRRQAAVALTRFGRSAIDIFLEALSTSDSYAKENICEEIQKSGFADHLIESLGSEDGPFRTKARDILRVMEGLCFSTPLVAYLSQGADERIKQEIRNIMTDANRP